MAHPGSLPVINKEAVKNVLRMGVALGGTLADFTEFDRKNYFYPDIPKGYQISQYKYPLVTGGSLNGVAITRVHLEEDTARSSHDQGDFSLVDYNRAGVPLMELVTEPVIHSAEEAGQFARELQLLLRTLGAGEANMEKGEMRVEANISVSSDPKKFGTKVEVKNINSFRAVERAILYEVERQSALLEKGESVMQETRGWDESAQKTFSQRLKENSHDYRYFPDPDIPKLALSELSECRADVLQKELPELPWQRRERYTTLFGMRKEEVELFLDIPLLASFFEAVMAEEKDVMKNARLAVNYLVTDVMGLLAKDGKSVESLLFTPKEFASLMRMISAEKVSSRGAKDILKVMMEEGGDPESIAEARDLGKKTDETELRQVVEKVMEQNESVVNDFRNGKEAVLKFLVGQGMKESKGSADPVTLEKLFRELSAKHSV